MAQTKKSTSQKQKGKKKAPAKKSMKNHVCYPHRQRGFIQRSLRRCDRNKSRLFQRMMTDSTTYFDHVYSIAWKQMPCQRGKKRAYQTEKHKCKKKAVQCVSDSIEVIRYWWNSWPGTAWCVPAGDARKPAPAYPFRRCCHCP